MSKIIRFTCLFLSFLLVSCAVASPAVPASTATPLLTQILNLTQAPASSIVALPDKNLGRVSTVLGDLEFTTLRLPNAANLSWVTSAPYGLVAIFSDGSNSAQLRWSIDGETWKGFFIPGQAQVVTADGEDVIVSNVGVPMGRTSLTRYVLGGDGFTEVTRLDIVSDIRQIVFGSHGAVAVSDGNILYSSDGIHFSKARRSPYEGMVPAGSKSSIGEYPFEGGCDPNWVGEHSGKYKIKKILAADDGFIALTPAQSGDWGKMPICEPLLWFSVDGNDWELVSDQSPFGNQAYVNEIAEWNDRFIAIGGSGFMGGAVWVSDNGLTWDRVMDLLSVPETIAAGAMGWILADNNFPVRNMWFSTNGMIWDGPYDFPDERRCGWLPLVLAVGPDTIFGGCVGDTPMLAHLQDWKRSSGLSGK